MMNAQYAESSGMPYSMTFMQPEPAAACCCGCNFYMMNVWPQ